MSSLEALLFSQTKCYVNSHKTFISQKWQLQIVWAFFFFEFVLEQEV